MPAKTIMIQGTASSVGKSFMTAAICRILKRKGLRVRPFKAQNMSNNAFVTTDGGEIGRAQAEQAKACGVEPTVFMNPILIKPTTDIGAQVIELGKPIGTLSAKQFLSWKPERRTVIRQALHQLMNEADVVVIEGAGSPAEVNLMKHDLVNMWVAREAGAQVLLVGDIDRGGVFAHLVGTLDLLGEAESLVKGFIINKFRGDLSLLKPGINWLEKRTGRPVLGTIPFLHDVTLAEEDAVALERSRAGSGTGRIRIEVIHLPRISNFTDFDALARQADVALSYIDRPSQGAVPDCVILPGTKSTIGDLAFLRARGFEDYLTRVREAGAEIVGICGGFQMLSRKISDPQHVESETSEVAGLGLLSGTAQFQKEKTTAQVRGRHLASGLKFSGYEIHMGQMRVDNGSAAVVHIRERSQNKVDVFDGLCASDGRVWGTHVHGLFDSPELREWWLNRLRSRCGLLCNDSAASQGLAKEPYDYLADHVGLHLDLKALYAMVSA